MNWLIGLVIIGGFAIVLQVVLLIRQSFALSSRLQKQYGVIESRLFGLPFRQNWGNSEISKLKTCQECITSLEDMLARTTLYLVITMGFLSIQIF